MAPFTLAGWTVTVDLRDVPLHIRLAVAEKLASVEGLTGVAYLELMLAAQQPGETLLDVDAAKAEYVFTRGKVPPGETPKHWTPVLKERWR